MFKEIAGYFFPCFVNAVTVLYLLSKVLESKINLKSPKTYLVLFGMVVLSILNFMFVEDVGRFVLITIFVGICNKLLFEENITVTILSTVVEQVVIILAEIIFAAIVALVVRSNGQHILLSYYGQLFSNVVISLLAILLVNLKFVRDIYKKLLQITTKLSAQYIMVIVTTLIIAINVILVFVYYEINMGYVLFANCLFFFLYGFLTYKILKEKNQSMKIQADNEALMNNLGEYEKMLDAQRILNHENKNQLVAIKGMFLEGEDVITYIDTITNDRKRENENLLMKTAHIPSGGLQGIIYSKMRIMCDKNIKVELQVSKAIKKLNFTNMDSNLNYDICRIIGVLLDNAIEESENTEKKEVSIAMYEENGQLIIEISNPCRALPILDKIYQPGYTTKGDGHGYGLSLVKSIIENNENITNEMEMIRDVFVQIIKIKVLDNLV